MHKFAMYEWERRGLTDLVVAKRLWIGEIIGGDSEASKSAKRKSEASAGGAAQGGAAAQIVDVEFQLSAPRLPNVRVPPRRRRRQPPARDPRQIAAAVRRRVARRLYRAQRRRYRLHQLVRFRPDETRRRIRCLLHFLQID